MNQTTRKESLFQLKTSTIQYRVDRGKINFIRFILEAYDGIAIMTTLDRNSGTIVLKIAPGCESEVIALMEHLAEDIFIEIQEKEPQTVGTEFS